MIDAIEAREQTDTNALMRQKAMFEAYPHRVKEQIAKIKTVIELTVDEGYGHCFFDTIPLSEIDIQKIMDYLSFYHFSLELIRGKIYQVYDPENFNFVYYNEYTIIISW